MLRGVRRTREGLPGLCFTFGTLQEWFLSIALMIGCLLNGNVFFLIVGLSRYLAKKSLFPSDCHFQSSRSTGEVVALKTIATFIFRFIQYILYILRINYPDIFYNTHFRTLRWSRRSRGPSSRSPPRSSSSRWRGRRAPGGWSWWSTRGAFSRSFNDLECRSRLDATLEEIVLF